ncbi:hypothetical protein VWN47_10060, partial [Campylobacter jejuni]
HYENYENIIVLSEALFSMDGDFSDFKTLCELKRRYDKIKLYMDEAPMEAMAFPKVKTKKSTSFSKANFLTSPKPSSSKQPTLCASS